MQILSGALHLRLSHLRHCFPLFEQLQLLQRLLQQGILLVVPHFAVGLHQYHHHLLVLIMPLQNLLQCMLHDEMSDLL